MHSKILGAVLVAGAMAAGLAACGGGGSSPTSPSPQPGGGGAPVATNTITITSAGAEPRNVTFAVGTKVTFVNNDSRSHDMNSGPHPAHTECAELNVGPIAPGQSRESQTFTTAKACSFHDHDLPTNTSLQGTVAAR